jgi:hypothetical protein
MNNPRFILVLGLSMLLWAGDGVCQERPQRPERPPVSNFNIQFLNLDGPSDLAVAGAGARSGFWANGRLHRIAGWKPANEVSAEVSVMHIEYWLEGDGVRLEVTAYLGKSSPYSRPDEWLKLDHVQVVSRLLNVDQLISITETERVGIEPFSVKVSRAQPWSIGAPEIINKTEALTVTGLTEERPTYTLTVRNVSHKNISGIAWYGVTNGRNSGGSAQNGALIIGAGRSFEVHQRFSFPESRPEAETEQPPKRAIVIAAIVFDDGTFEGETDKCAEMAAGIAGHRIQYVRAVELLRGVSLIPGDDHAQILLKLKQDIGLFSEVPDQEVVNELVSRFATASDDTRNRRIKEEVSNSLKSAKHHLLQIIESMEYQRSSAPDQADLELWLKKAIAMFERSSGSN